MTANRIQTKQKPLPALDFSIRDLWSGVNTSVAVQQQVERFNPSGELEEGGAAPDE